METHTTTLEESSDAIRKVRTTVFIEEQGVPPEMEFDDDDRECVHVVVTDGGRAVGTGRLGGDGRIGRMAVLKEMRGRGVGRTMLRALEDVARQRGMERLWAHGQVHALGFYESMGFQAAGEEFMEAGIAHRMIEKTLR